MRLLFVTYRFPAYTHDATCNTVYHLVKYFSQRHQISLVALASSEELAQTRDLVAPYCHRIETVVVPPWRSGLNALRGLLSREPLQMWVYRSARMARRVRDVIAEEGIELAYGYHLRSGQYLADLNTIPRCIALQPAQILHFGRRKEYISNPIRRWGYTFELSRLQGYELQMAKNFDASLLISEKDQAAIDPEGELKNVFFNPHGVDIDEFVPDFSFPKEKNTLVFTGALSIDTNSDAVLYFCHSIYPLIKSRIPDVKLYIVGKGPPAAVRAMSEDPSIVVTGYVEDLRPYLWRAEVGIDPLRIGAGLQNKVLEGMAVGLPMVLTSVANEGIGATHEDNILIGDTPDDFAAGVVRLLENSSLRGEIGQRGRAFIAQNWSWEAYFEPLEALFQDLVQKRV